jgi:hypothetical protein
MVKDLAKYALWTIFFLCVTHCKPAQRSESSDTGIVTTQTRNQGASAFCWAYATVAHIEQRYYEQTRGPNRGGFRLDLSEEYLGLLHLAGQLTSGKITGEGLLLSESLDLLDKYGIVPEKVGDEELFAAKFDFSMSETIQSEAEQYWIDHRLAPQSEIPLDQALLILQKVSRISDRQLNFLRSVLTDGSAKFSYRSHKNFDQRMDYTPQVFLKEFLKFNPADYYILKMPDSGRSNFGNLPYTDDYQRAISVIKKAMLYGYSVPTSFNHVQSSILQNGTLQCVEQACFDAQLSAGNEAWPHANHAVLLIDFRSASTTFNPMTESQINTTFNEPVVEWVIKNSWGFDRGTSNHPDLLRRFPVPAYTVMKQDFFEASHRLNPGRYEAIVPRRVCLRDASREQQCKNLISSTQKSGLLTETEIDLSLDTGLITQNFYSETFESNQP